MKRILFAVTLVMISVILQAQHINFDLKQVKVDEQKTWKPLHKGAAWMQGRSFGEIEFFISLKAFPDDKETEFRYFLDEASAKPFLESGVAYKASRTYMKKVEGKNAWESPTYEEIKETVIISFATADFFKEKYSHIVISIVSEDGTQLHFSGFSSNLNL